MLLKCKVTGVEQEFAEAQAKKILSMFDNGGWELVNKNDSEPQIIDTFTDIEGITEAMQKKLYKKGIVNYSQLFGCCEKTQKEIGLTAEIMQRVEEVLRNEN